MSVSTSIHIAPDDGVSQRRAELASLMKRFAPEFGVHPTAIEALHLIRSDQPTEALHTVHKPGLCVIIEGRKEVRLADECYVYDPLNYLVVSVTLPLAGQVIEASPERPYLCIRLDIDPAQICRLIADASPIGVPAERTDRGLFLDRIDAPLLDAMLRLLRLLDSPDDIATLAPLAQQEIFYRLLRGTQGQRLHEIAIPDTQTHRISRAIEWLNTHYAKPLSIDSLAQMINLSPSALHHRFKAVTAMSPLQYQKQLRLQEARRLLLAENSDVSSIGYKVGYESPSQFSREYSRLFGASPSKDIARLRAQALQASSA
ncbi:Helix-turn-helix domain-containing protein [Pseudomonas sp. NFACC23-1]|uniref:AraC family transcriptional regulator n=1 Tax=unclassified Pseudomonas TaxID=196821 RepID=UPI00088B35DE|nr:MULTISPECIES: AraC family transcriptional regulator [unclassified Pseudomonas]SDB67270.1 Helix-turn-helix domain-containing protein [Pseudomonas sp. NFACC17-2]SEJ99023.1 Helix-turn-helix domain-containing protein [Pseudomonas sp. NFACC23-1]SFW93081.1 Helix-turn-helix domain-containing protein [Pseudomonas sp. NFACC16-2]